MKVEEELSRNKFDYDYLVNKLSMFYVCFIFSVISSV